MTTATSLTPLQPTDRIHSLDIMRGIVLFGILLMNIHMMGLANAYSDPTVAGGSRGWDLYTWMITNMLFEGTMRALFSLLFGVGMYILLDRLEKKGAGIKAADIYFRRLLWLLLFGLIHGYLLLWTGEILYNYALMGFLVYSFRHMSPKKLIGIAILLMAFGSAWSYIDYKKDVKFMAEVEQVSQYQAEGKPLTDELKEASLKWDQIQSKRSPEAVEKFNSNMRKGYFDLVAFLAPINRDYNQHDPYRWDVWDVLSMMLIGIALFKMKILSAGKSYLFYTMMVIIGYLIGLIVNYYETMHIVHQDFSLLSFSKTNITYDLGRIPTAIGHIGLILIFCKLPFMKWLKSALSSVGKMALTNYVMHSVFAMIIFTGAGLGLFGTFSRHELLYIVFAIWIFQLIVSPIWLKYFHFGPLEWIWRNLSYQKKHRIKKDLQS